ncbi:MAG: hypothetical protein LPK45_11120, partial [Bacteroidota bacterium]|nr:hypothetical protein [Bacteroidota bacterium]MDX5431653.1 hypothetical protein [Bacteroidota bacterium]MDX5470371.1 hypothetical protein [Bacteroidota bacterium]
MAQNCTITGPTEGCANSPATFSVQADPGDQVSWSTSTNQTAQGGSAQFTFPQYGQVKITVTITKPDGSKCTQDLIFEVHDLPTADFSIDSDPYQCYSN